MTSDYQILVDCWRLGASIYGPAQIIRDALRKAGITGSWDPVHRCVSVRLDHLDDVLAALESVTDQPVQLRDRVNR